MAEFMNNIRFTARISFLYGNIYCSNTEGVNDIALLLAKKYCSDVFVTSIEGDYFVDANGNVKNVPVSLSGRGE